MSLPMPSNVKVDIYRSASPATPYALGNAASVSVPGYLQPRVQTGRHGTAQWLKWTHILYLDSKVDVRDAYNSQLDPGRDNTKADTVILNDATNSTKTAFYVVFVEPALFGTPSAHLRVYLDRFQPASWPTTAL